MLAAGLLLLLLAAYTLPALTRVSAGAAGDWRVRAGDDTTDDENRSSVPPCSCGLQIPLTPDLHIEENRICLFC